MLTSGRRQSRRGFTLVELLITMVLLGGVSIFGGSGTMLGVCPACRAITSYGSTPPDVALCVALPARLASGVVR